MSANDPPDSAQVTELLRAWADGDQGALDRLAPVVYAELKRIARRHMHGERQISLQPTALVHEAWLRLAGSNMSRWQDRVHFFAVASTLMRRTLVDAARRRVADKRGGPLRDVGFNESVDAPHTSGSHLLRLDDALQDLAKHDARKAKVVELRFFGGLSVEETAEMLGISTQSVFRDWTLARSWLLKAMH